MKPFKGIDDEDVLKELRKGSDLAFECIYRHFQPSLIFFARRLLINFDIGESEEIVQDVFLKLYDKRKSFDSLSKVKAFLYLSTKNSCLNKIEKEKVQRKRFDLYIETFSEEDESFITSEIIYAEVVREVGLAIEELPEKCRIIIREFLDGNKNAKEIAEKLNITVSTVNNQKARGILLLKQKLSRSGTAFLLFNLLM
ncbi:RNA polymerase sigma factor [Chryseobacterium defluvii]|uniref:RNA polymerase sigma-70 factor (ECF subfamily) n=1 Tax=Chryseobacterium defluvii TaxID=160396 RepID=A0A495SND7_9FLAO|nr:sigma-70 family RNA polymerase sigma factor [Chryseobacterium defluvii]RKT01753.1 RNA polymerase sigma-70 factor (ECF subfamily) [Chryseobacterium defluvii]